VNPRSIQANGITLQVEDSGPGDAEQERPVVLLISGLGLQLVAWPHDLLAGLVQAGYRVICFDNRDVGLSTKLEDKGVPNVLWATIKHRLGLKIRPPYTLKDMARDALGVLDALHIRHAHVMGVSMGGMIAQRLALMAPKRVLSLTSLMSSSGARGLPGPSREVMKVLFSRPNSHSAEDVVNHMVHVFNVIGSRDFPADEAAFRASVLQAYHRCYSPSGTVRQMVAIAADSGRRAQKLPLITCPTLVLHGHHDPLVPFVCGIDTASRIPGAHLVGIEGMGHDLPPGVVERLLPPLLTHLQDAGDLPSALPPHDPESTAF